MLLELARRLINPVFLHRRQRPQRYAFLAQLLETQALGKAEVRRNQRTDLAAMLRHARTATRYYADALRDLPDTSEICALPILTKDAVRSHLPDLLARGHDPSATPLGHTGGSTGQPLAFYYNEAKHELMRAGMMRSYMLSGWQPGQRILNFWGARQDTVRGGVFGSAAWDDFVAAEKTLPADKIDPVRLRAWADYIRRYRPTLLQGYASILALLAHFILDEKYPMPAGLIGVYSTAETLTDAMRETIQRAFGCKVFNQYGSREIPNIACECRRGNMHIWSDMVWLESLEGRLLVTSLTNRLMPMIRYENGDCGELRSDECDCGLPFPLMKMGVCRQNDLILAPDGRRLHPSFFNRLLYGQTQVQEYQFVQEVPGKVMLRLTGCAPSAEATARMRSAVAAEGLLLEIEAVAEIERTISGKHRFVVSRL
jgi:phenylacetate-CoA ligase